MASSSTPFVSFSSQFYRTLLNLYPRSFREEYEREMVIVFCDSLRATHRAGEPIRLVQFWLAAIVDLIVTALEERFANGSGPRRYFRGLISGLVAGAVGGLVVGLGARLAMRGVVYATGLTPNFTLEGTFTIFVIGLILGIFGGLLYLPLRSLIPGTGIWKGLAYGILLFVIFLAPPFLFYREGEATLATPLITLSLFGPVAIAYGLTLELTLSRLNQQSQLNPTHPNALSTIFWFGLFACVLELSVLGTTSILNHMPRIPPAIVRLQLPFTTLRDSNIWLINLITLSYFGLSSLIFWSRSRHLMARLTGCTLFLFGGALFNTGAGYYDQLADPASLRPFFNLIQVLGVTSLLALLYLFPNGRFSPAWTRPLGIAWVAFALVWFSTSLPEPLTFTVIIAFLGSGLLAQLQRFRQAPDPERPQLRWPLIGFTIAIIGFTGVALAILIVPDLKLPKVDGLAVTATFGLYMLPWLFIPLSIGWAMRKHKLWAAEDHGPTIITQN